MLKFKLPGRRKAFVFVFIALSLIAGFIVYGSREEPPPDVRPTGLYVAGDHNLVFSPRTSDSYRATFPATGESHAFRADADSQRWEAGPGWSDPAPVNYSLTFEENGEKIDGLLWEEAGEETLYERVDLPEKHYRFESGDLSLRAKLVTPEGEGPFPVVVAVHGSESYSAVDYYDLPYLLAGHGIAGLVYDKRGTGGSTGEYTQYFPALAGDALAAVRSLESDPRIDQDRVFLVGFSQAGWIAPLAAARSDGAVRGVVVAYGPTVPIAEEDRWGYVYQLQKHGFGDEEIAEADAINALLGECIEGRKERCADFSEALDAARGQSWLDAVAGSDSILGYLSGAGIPMWMMRIVHAYRTFTADGPVNDRYYDPVPVLEELEIPMLWMFGGEDSSIPTGASIARLEPLIEEFDKPFEIVLFPEAEHGMLHFEDVEEDGVERRRYLGYAPGYHRQMIDWLLREAGLRHDTGVE